MMFLQQPQYKKGKYFFKVICKFVLVTFFSLPYIYIYAFHFFRLTIFLYSYSKIIFRIRCSSSNTHDNYYLTCPILPILLECPLSLSNDVILRGASIMMMIIIGTGRHCQILIAWESMSLMYQEPLKGKKCISEDQHLWNRVIPFR